MKRLAILILAAAAAFSAVTADAATKYTLTLKASPTKGGSVAGGGKFAANRVISLKATAKKGYAFAGWFTDKSCKKALNPQGFDNRKPSVKHVMPNKATTYYAKFVTKAADKKALKFKSSTTQLAKKTITYSVGQKVALKLGISSASLPTVTAKGLPSGLKIDKATGKIAGTPTKAGSYTATVAVKSAAGNKITLKLKFTIKKAVNYKGYCVIDLSDGPDAESYPVSYTDSLSGSWSDAYKTSKLVLRLIPAGSFTMGRAGDSYACNPHKVKLSRPFYIGVFEVTMRQYELVTGERHGSSFINSLDYATRPAMGVSYDMIRGSSKGAGWPESAAVDASSFLGKLRAKTGIDFDLPTEAQWEYACRAGTSTDLNSGKNLVDLGKAWKKLDPNFNEVGRYEVNAPAESECWVGWEATVPPDAKVGSYLPNAWGLYDMHGNAWEWCLDLYSSFGLGDATDPKGYSHEAIGSSSPQRILRGGSWNELYPGSCTSFYRDHNAPSSDYLDVGFRLAGPVK